MIIIKEAGRKSLHLLPDFGSFSTDCSVILDQLANLYSITLRSIYGASTGSSRQLSYYTSVKKNNSYIERTCTYFFLRILL